MSDIASSRFETSEGADEGSLLALVSLSEFPAPQGEISPWLRSGVEQAIYLQSTGRFPLAVAFVDEANTSWWVTGWWGCQRPQWATICCCILGFRCFGGDRWVCRQWCTRPGCHCIVLRTGRGQDQPAFRRKAELPPPCGMSSPTQIWFAWQNHLLAIDTVSKSSQH